MYLADRGTEVATKEDLDRKGDPADVIRGGPMTAEGTGRDSKMIEGVEGQTFGPDVNRQPPCQNLPSALCQTKRVSIHWRSRSK
jgi:hypothetical protein